MNLTESEILELLQASDSFRQTVAHTLANILHDNEYVTVRPVDTLDDLSE